MTAIAGIATTEFPWHGHEQSKPSKDFAQELVKQHGPSHDEAKAFAGDEKTGAPGETASGNPKSDVPAELPQVATVDQAHCTSVDMLSAAGQLGDATTQPVGVTEALLGARVFGWHALAQSYLSELAAFDASPGEGELPTEAKASLIQLESQAASVADEEPSSVAETGAMTEAPEVPHVAGPTPGIESERDPVSGMEANEPCLAAMTSVGYWAERSLRFTRQPDGLGVAWLRDYRLDAAMGSQVVRLVLQEAKARGVALDRIMLNGREAWSSRSQV